MGKTILLADDNDSIRRSACALLMSEDELTSWVEARDGLEAVRLAKDLSPDLVILDYSMPIMDGLEAARNSCLTVVPIVLF
ncbi:MAG: response regulator, partial [Acidobacteriales bacterium]|nr:response regulator [Terriglobales bacterium]